MPLCNNLAEKKLVVAKDHLKHTSQIKVTVFHPV